MTNKIAMAMPLLPGKRDALTAFTQALLNERSTEYNRVQESVITEDWFLQPTPMGSLVIIHFEAPDPMAVMAGLALSQEPFDVWFREQVRDITGLDLTQPVDLPEQVFHWEKQR